MNKDKNVRKYRKALKSHGEATCGSNMCICRGAAVEAKSQQGECEALTETLHLLEAAPEKPGRASGADTRGCRRASARRSQKRRCALHRGSHTRGHLPGTDAQEHLPTDAPRGAQEPPRRRTRQSLQMTGFHLHAVEATPHSPRYGTPEAHLPLSVAAQQGMPRHEFPVPIQVRTALAHLSHVKIHPSLHVRFLLAVGNVSVKASL